MAAVRLFSFVSGLMSVTKESVELGMLSSAWKSNISIMHEIWL
jgi:hypothetical protein